MPETTRYQRGRLYPLDINQIQPDPNQPRKYFDEVALEELVVSIRSKGVLQPILFRKDENNRLILVSGERRFKAAQKAELEKIPGIYTDGDPTEISLVENLLRENLTPVEEAEGMKRLKDMHEYTDEQLAETLGKGRSTITEILSLNKLPQGIRDECRVNPKCSRRVLVEIAKKKQDKAMLSLYKKYKDRGLTSDEVRHITRARKDDVESAIKMVRGLTTRLNHINSSDNWDFQKKQALLGELARLSSTVKNIMDSVIQDEQFLDETAG